MALVVAGSSSVTRFRDLLDTPASYAGQAYRLVRVNGASTGLEFTDAVDSDDKVKARLSDPSAGYLVDKINTAQLGINGSNKLYVLPSVFAPYDHLADSNNPHSVTAAQVGRDTAQWNANQILDIPIVGVPSNNQILRYNANSDQWEPSVDLNTGEVNTGANLGVGAWVFKQKSGLELQFRSFGIGSNKMTISSANDVIRYDVNPSVIDHQTFLGSGTYDHAAIDDHIDDTSNPHNVTAAQVGNSTAQWNASQIRGLNVNAAAAAEGKVMVYRSGALVFEDQLDTIVSPGGQATYVQYRDANGDFAGDAQFMWNDVLNVLSITGAIHVDNIVLDGNSIVTQTGNLVLTPATALVLDGLTWPTADGANGQVLVTNGNGVLSWSNQTATASAAGSNQQVQFNSGGNFAGSANLLFNGSSLILNGSLYAGNLNIASNILSSGTNYNLQLSPGAGGNIMLSGTKWPATLGTAGNVLQLGAFNTLAWVDPKAAAVGGSVNQIQYHATGGVLAGDPQFTWNDITNTLTITGSAAVDNLLLDNNSLSSTAGNLVITANNTLVLQSLNWPATPGSNGQMLTTDGIGQLSWTTPPGAGGGGEINTASNLGSGTGLFKSKVSTDLQFRSLSVADPKLGISVANDVVILSFGSVSLSDLSDVSGTPASGDILKFNGTDWVASDSDSVSAAGSVTQVLYHGSDGNIAGDAQLTWNDVTNTLSINGSAVVDNVTIDGSSISTTANNNPLILSAHGTGRVVLDGMSWPAADGSNGQVLSTNGAGSLSWTAMTAGEINTASSVGSGSSIVKGKVGVDLQFKSLTAGTAIGLTNNTNDVAIAVLPGSIPHQSLSGAGSFTHANIDAHINNILNPHGVTAGQVGNTTAQWNANQIVGVPVIDTNKANGRVLQYNSGNSSLEYVDIITGVTGAAGSNQQVQFNSNGNFAGANQLVFDNSINRLSVSGSFSVDNLLMDGNVLSSTNANGNISLQPNGSGKILLDAVYWPNNDGSNGQVISTDGSGNLSWVSQPAAPVTSVFGRTGAITATAGDYSANKISFTPGGTISSTDVQAAIAELGVEKISDISSFSIHALADVTITNPSNGQLLTYQSGQWVNFPASSVPTSLDDLSDVTITNPVLNHVLTWNGSAWVNQAPTGGGGGSIAELSDVTITDPSTDQVLTWDGSEWVNQSILLTIDDLTDVTINEPALNQVLAYNGSQWVNQAPTGGDVLSVFGRTGAVVAAANDYSADKIAFTPAGSIAATEVQAAIVELDSEKLSDITNEEIGDLSNVSTSGATDGDVLVLQSGVWTKTDFRLPTWDGTAGQTLTTNGAGQLDWAANFPIEGNRLISGSHSWVSGLTFDVTPCSYIINGIQYNTAATQVTLDPAPVSPNGSRFDCICVNAAQQVVVIAGTPSVNPARPDVPDNHIAITFVLVPEDSLVPSITTTNIYLENTGVGGGEWNFSSSGTGTMVGNSAASPYSGSYSIEATNVAVNSYIRLTAGSIQDLTSIDYLSFYIKNKVSLLSGGNNFKISVRFLNAGVQNGAWVDAHLYGYDRVSVAGYQLVALDKALFTLTSNSVNAIEIRVRGTGTTLTGFYVDNAQLQAGVPLEYPQPTFKYVQATTGEAVADNPSDTIKFVGASGITTSITNKIVTITGPSVPSAIDDLTDVTITNPSSGHVLTWNGSAWINQAPAGGSVALNDLTDVVVANPAATQFLYFDGSNWINTAVSIDVMSDVTITNPATGQLLRFDGSNWVNGTLAETINGLASGTSVADDVLVFTDTSVSGTGKQTTVEQVLNVQPSVTNSGNLTGAVSFDASTASLFKGTLTGNITFTLTNPPKDDYAVTLRLRQDGTGGRTITAGTGIRFGYEINSTHLAGISTAANSVCRIGLRYNSDDSKWDLVALASGYV